MNPRRVCRQRRHETRRTAKARTAETAPTARTAPKGVDPGQLAVWAWEDFLWAQEVAEDEARRAERAQFLTAVNGWPPALPDRYERWAPRR